MVPKDSVIKWNRSLVAVDVSSYGDKICKRALDIARNFNSEINVISVVEVPSEVFAIKPEIFDTQIEKIKNYLKDVEAKFQKDNVFPKIIVDESKPYKKILEKVDVLGATIIIIGSHGKTGLRRLLMGSTCQRVIGLSKVPVLVVK